MSFFLQVCCAIFSGVIFALALPNELLKFGSPLFGLVALIPYYIAISHAKNFTRAMHIAMIQSLTTHLLSSFWLAFFKSAGVITLGSSAIGTSALSSFFGALFFMAKSTEPCGEEMRVAAGLSTWRIPLRVFWFSCSYVVWEWVKSCGFLGYPWGVISATAFNWKFIMQIADITGTYGITFLFVLFASIVGEYILLRSNAVCENHFAIVSDSTRKVLRQTFFAWAIFFAAATIYGVYQMGKPREIVKTMNTVVVQQNYDPWQSTDDTLTILDSQKMSFDKISENTALGKQTDIVVWSEGALSYSFPDSVYHYEINPKENPLIPFIAETQTPFLIGGSYVLDWYNYKFVNAAFLFQADGNVSDEYYGKLHLVPFAEAIPFMDMSESFRNFVIENFGFPGWTPGDKYTIFEIPLKSVNDQTNDENKENDLLQTRADDDILPKNSTVKFSTPICYDDAFPGVMRPLWKAGTEVFLNISDDSWSRTKSAEIQHAVVAAYRAIECRTTLVRSTNAGYTVVFDPTANIIFDMPLFESTAENVTVPIYERKCTAYIVFGNWLAVFCIIFATGFSAFVYIYDKKPRKVIKMYSKVDSQQ